MINWTDVESKLASESQGFSGYVHWNLKLLQKNVFPEIEENINEWANNKPFSDIKIGEWSVVTIKRIYPNAPFVYIVQCLKDYVDSGYKDIYFGIFDKR